MNAPTTLAAEVNRFFPKTYPEARDSFLEAVQGSPDVADVLDLPLDESLCTETAWIGPRDAERVLVLISGTHGVEGPVGTAVQLDFLACRPLLPPDTAALLVFALNPYGFAHARRCDRDGIDLNRNFIDFSQPLPDNPGYTELRGALYQPHPERLRRFETYRMRHGQAAFERAISGGQYTDPCGPFFGGTAPGHGNRCIEAIIGRHRLEGRHLKVIDIHSGLGPYGHGEIVCDHPPGTNGYAEALGQYDASATTPIDGTSSSVQKQGLLDYRWHALMAQRGSFVTLEFGTYPIAELFRTVLDDHRAHHLADADEIRRSAVAMREHFCPANGHWRELALLKGRQTIQMALESWRHD